MDKNQLLDALKTACRKGDKIAAETAAAAIAAAGLHWVAIYNDGCWANNPAFIVNNLNNPSGSSIPTLWKIGEYDEIFK